MIQPIIDDYDAGFQAGLEKAYDLIGKLAVFYRDNIVCGDDWPDEEKKSFNRELKAQVNACRYAQYVIQSGEFDEEDDTVW